MKALLICFIGFVSFYLAGCSKEVNNTPEQYYISFKVNNVSTTLYGSPQAFRGNNPASSDERYTAGVHGLNDSLDFGIWFYPNTAPVKTNTVYSDSQNAQNMVMYLTTPGADYSSDSSSQSHVKFQITKITATEMQGTFSGNLIRSPNSSGPDIVISNGVFWLPFSAFPTLSDPD